MKTIYFLTNVTRRFTMMQQAMKSLQEAGELAPSCQCYWIDMDTAWSPTWQQALKDAHVVYVKWMGSGIDTPFLKKLIDFFKSQHIPFYMEAAGSLEGELIYKIEIDSCKTLESYMTHGGIENYRNGWRYLEHYEDPSCDVTPPKALLWYGIFHPDAEEAYTDVEAYMAAHCDPQKPTIGLLFYREEWIWKDLAYQTAIIREAEKQGLNVIAVFSNGIPDRELGIPPLSHVFKRLFARQGLPIIDTLINCIKFSLTGSNTVDIPFLKEWNVPILQAYTLLTDYPTWYDHFEGMSAMEVSISVSLPEFDGVLHGLPVSTKEDMGHGETKYMPLMERIPPLVRKARKWAQLRRKANKDKKIAIIFHNYPPSNATIGSAVGLDTIESVRRIMKGLSERGYTIEAIPDDGKTFIKELTANATNDRSLLTDKQIAEAFTSTKSDYEAYYQTIPEGIRQTMEKQWGKAPGEVMVYENEVLVPGTLYGNIFITVQPPRGFGEDPGAIYHSPDIPPTHQYIAFYNWLRHVWQADAIAHIGTHGNLEWLPGKNAGLSDKCYPHIALDDLPNVYPYLITITGEGIQAKRRSNACLIEHLPAPQTHAGLYDELEELEKAMDEYIHFTKSYPEQKDTLAAMEALVHKKVGEAHLEEEVPYRTNDGESFEAYLGRLHSYITDIKNLEVHTGLHILGQPPDQDQIVEYLLLLTRMENGSIPPIYEVIARAFGGTYDEYVTQSATIYEPLNITYGALIDLITERARGLVRALEMHQFALSWEDVKTLGHEEEALAWILTLPETIEKELATISDFICQRLAKSLYLTTQELTNMLNAFEGQFIEPGPSGAPSSGGADLLPTGRNFYGVDPRTLPTQGAWELGKLLGDQVIERFILEEGHYPESIGIILWSGANMRSHGQCVAEFLYLLGLQPIWQRGSLRVVGFQVIPLAELGRPRIDVTGRISGLFRDTLPNLGDLLDRAVQEVAALEEPLDMNYVRKHVLADSADLEVQGIDKKDAWRQASYRIFGCPPGSYGAGVSELLEEKNWETLDDLAEVYIRWGAHAYGGTTRGDYVPSLFRKRMSTLDVTIKNEDNHETNMLSSDDYNAYHGGMIATVRSLRGKAPQSYCGDSTNRKKVQLHSLQEETKRIFRSEAINPKFIEGMMKHGYKGAMDMAKYVAHSYQWDATSAVMEDWMYEAYAAKYVFDPKVQEWMKDVNPWALQSLVATLLEAQQRGLWNAQEDTLAQLRELYLHVEGDMEEKADMG